MRLTLKATSRLAKAGGYFYFQLGEAEEWLDRTVNVPTVNSLTLPEWMAEFERLKKVNAEIMGAKRGKPAPKRRQTNVKP